MGFKLTNTEEDYKNLTVVNDKEQVITTYTNVENLFANGLKFEACISQAGILEAVCYYYLILEKHQGSLKFDSDSERKIKTNDLTFGRTKTLLITHKIVTDDKQVQMLKDYVDKRNLLTHRLIAEMKVIDFDEFFKNGNELLFSMWRMILKSTEEIRNKVN
ncbi:hypothetical protein JMN32_05130 [Fulvivirga sp. 29W222]|uniref:Uncharacterized protein n=1 Tax=Fulvivirga marina TaxID=2494733 RepID=A0A937FWI7_9BACT|nr:hypothetical protein [Fulvivirga marina]MBL6445680.1 hypothetical protein [Fulvivirga marina]